MTRPGRVGGRRIIAGRSGPGAPGPASPRSSCRPPAAPSLGEPHLGPQPPGKQGARAIGGLAETPGRPSWPGPPAPPKPCRGAPVKSCWPGEDRRAARGARVESQLPDLALAPGAGPRDWKLIRSRRPQLGQCQAFFDPRSLAPRRVASVWPNPLRADWLNCDLLHRDRGAALPSVLRLAPRRHLSDLRSRPLETCRGQHGRPSGSPYPQPDLEVNCFWRGAWKVLWLSLEISIGTSGFSLGSCGTPNTIAL